MLYARQDLLDKYPSVPRPPYATYDDLIEAASSVLLAEQAAGSTALRGGYIFSSRSREALTASAVEWIATRGGGRILNSRGGVTVNNPIASDALWSATQWVSSGVVPREFLNRTENEAVATFRLCETVFMRNLPYVLPTTDSSYMRCNSGVTPNVTVTALPGASLVDGWGLAVSKYSKVREMSATLVMFLARKELQVERAFNQALFPSRASAVETVCAANATDTFIGCAIYSTNFTATHMSMAAGIDRHLPTELYFARWLDDQMTAIGRERASFNDELRTAQLDIGSIIFDSPMGGGCGIVRGVLLVCADGLECRNGICRNPTNLIIGIAVPFGLILLLAISVMILFPYRKRAGTQDILYWISVFIGVANCVFEFKFGFFMSRFDFILSVFAI